MSAQQSSHQLTDCPPPAQGSVMRTVCLPRDSLPQWEGNLLWPGRPCQQSAGHVHARWHGEEEPGNRVWPSELEVKCFNTRNWETKGCSQAVVPQRPARAVLCCLSQRAASWTCRITQTEGPESCPVGAIGRSRPDKPPALANLPAGGLQALPCSGR